MWGLALPARLVVRHCACQCALPPPTLNPLPFLPRPLLAHVQSAPGVAAAAQPAGWRRWARPGTLFKTLLVATALAVVALAGWGLALSIQATNSTFSDLWELVQDVNLRVRRGQAG